MAQLAEAYVTIRADTKTLPGELGGVQAMFRGVIDGISTGVAAAGMMLEKLVHFAKEFTFAAAEAEVTQMRLAGAIKATGRGEFYQDAVEKLAKMRAETTAFGEEATKAAGASIARFQYLGDETLVKVLEVAQDLSAQFGGDLKSTATALARALENVDMAKRLLVHTGIMLTREEQQQLTLTKQRDGAAAAQVQLLEIVSQKAPEAAESFAKTFQGMLQQMKNLFHELAVIIGKRVLPALKSVLQPIMDLTRWIRDLAKDTDSFGGKMAVFAGSLASTAIQATVLIMALKGIKLWLDMLKAHPVIALMSIGFAVGTFAGEKLFGNKPEENDVEKNLRERAKGQTREEIRDEVVARRENARQTKIDMQEQYAAGETEKALKSQEYLKYWEATAKIYEDIDRGLSPSKRPPPPEGPPKSTAVGFVEAMQFSKQMQAEFLKPDPLVELARQQLGVLQDINAGIGDIGMEP